MQISEIIELCQSLALDLKFNPDEAAMYRRFCRQYSKKFYTPLNEVFKLDAIHVIQTIFEDQMEDFDLENEEQVERMRDLAHSLADPSYEGNKEADLEDWMADALEEEKARVRDNTPLTKALARKKTPVKQEEKPKELPKSGGINLSYLAESENES